MDLATKPITLILDGAVNLAPNLIADDGSIAMRITHEDFSRELCYRFQKPIVSTSVNISGMPAAKKFGEISEELLQQADYVCWSRRQEKQPHTPSSIIRLTKGKAKFAMKLRVPYWATEGFDIKLNGKSIASHYQPSSYVEIPARRWSTKDVVEVTMPFTKHIDFGPDKVDGYWLGALMQGPLVMAATNVKSWDEATVDLSSALNHQPSSFNLVPDYEGDKHLTHYFRLNLPASTVSMVGNLPTDRSQLRELLLIAKSRMDDQQAWHNMTVKVPEYAPWASHGFARMAEQYKQAQSFMEGADDRYSQEEVDKVAAALNAIINAMRPGNLAEPEDLEELQSLLEKVGQLPANDHIGRATSYANMVIRYVSDGSGTKDMIERATNQLKEILK
jgi:hypothetical protein